MGSRRRARHAALQMLYAMDASGASAEQIIAAFWSGLEEPSDATEFADELVRGVSSQLADIDETIRRVSQHWRLERMARVDRNVLRLGIYELRALADVPRRVTLNEAIELGKRFGTSDSAAFINGILDRVANDLQKA